MTDELSLPYSDNDRSTVAARLRAEIAEDPDRLDVASGYFAPSVWAAIGDALDKVGEFRLLLGTDHELMALATSAETRNVEQLVKRAIDREVQPEDLVSRELGDGLVALIDFIERQRKDGREVVKLWRGEGFLHAKAYLLDGSAGIGSANFTFNGLSRNRELVGWRQDRREVKDVREWYERYWDHADTVPYTDAMLAALRSTPLISDEYTPYDVLIRTLAARYGGEQPPSLEQASFSLKWFQEDAVMRLVRLLNGPARGALLADAVGLGKTYMALGVIHHYLYVEAEARRGQGKPVLLVTPASLERMWRGVLEAEGLDWACRILTTQRLRDDFDVSGYGGHDLVVIDEAHRLRGGGTWFRKMTDLLAQGAEPDQRRVLLLTATPVNTGMSDLKRLLQILTKSRRAAWAPEIADFDRYLDRVEKSGADPFPLLDRSLVRRSRTDIVTAEADAKAAGLAVEAVKLPKRSAQHIDYGYDSAGAELFDKFARALRGLSLVPYDLARWQRDAETAEGQGEHLRAADGSDIAAPDDVSIRPGTLAALYAAGLLTRFQSSIPAIRKSLLRLDSVLARFTEALAQSPPRILDLANDRTVQVLIADEASGRDRDAAEGDGGEGFSDDEMEDQWTAALHRAPALAEPDRYDLDGMKGAVAHDREEIADLLGRLPAEIDDGKIAALIRALETDPKQGTPGSPGLAGQRILVFTQFRDTARYVHARLAEPDVADRLGLAAVTDGSVGAESRAAITAWFDPDATEQQMAAAGRGEEEPRILVSTDVLAEGHNLQEASAVVNFDLHFNPQVAVQRSGRVDRLGSRHARVTLLSMLPPEDLDRHIGLLGRLDERFRRIHGLGLGDEQVMPVAGDVQGQTLEQVRRLYRDDATVLDEIERSWTFGSTDFMRQPLSAFLTAAGREQLAAIPYGVSSVKRLPERWAHGPGVFLALAAPAPSGKERETYWRFYPGGAQGYGQSIRDDVEIFKAIACRQGEPRATLAPVPDGPGVFDWELIAAAAAELASELTLQRGQAEFARGASERSRKVRTEIRAGAGDLDVGGLGDLLDRLLQVRVEDYDGRSGWRPFDDARRLLKRADTEGERGDAAQALAERGLELFGPPVAQDDEPAATDVAPGDIRLVAYEALVGADAPAPTEEQMIMEGGTDQALLVEDETRLDLG